MDRVRIWLAVSPLVGAGVLLAHGLAYRLTGADAAPIHAYLDHAPQVLVVMLLVGACFAALGPRARGPSVRLVPVAALVAFAVQEHVERLVHTGELPLLATTPAFLVGLLLQVPVALCAWALARWLLRAVAEPAGRPPHVPWMMFAIVVPDGFDVDVVRVRPLPGRGPPLLPRH